MNKENEYLTRQIVFGLKRNLEPHISQFPSLGWVSASFCNFYFEDTDIMCPVADHILVYLSRNQCVDTVQQVGAVEDSIVVLDLPGVGIIVLVLLW